LLFSVSFQVQVVQRSQKPVAPNAPDERTNRNVAGSAVQNGPIHISGGNSAANEYVSIRKVEFFDPG
jgi:hypothetical protein